MQNEVVKSAYLFSCFCGLRISDIIGLQWKDVFIDNGQCRLAVAMQKTKEPIYLPLSNEADIGGRSVHRIEITRPYVRENDSGVCQDHQSEEGRCGQLGQWTVQLIRRESYLLIYCF